MNEINSKDQNNEKKKNKRFGTSSVKTIFILYHRIPTTTTEKKYKIVILCVEALKPIYTETKTRMENCYRKEKKKKEKVF